jgi:DNA polymerase III delta subunit
VRGRPVFAISAKPGSPGDNYLFLYIKNILDEDIVVDNWKITPALVGLSVDHSIRSILKAQLSEIPLAILRSQVSLMLLLLILPAATNQHNETVTISAQWASTGKPWPFRRRIKIKTTVARLMELQAAHLPNQGLPIIG